MKIANKNYYTLREWHADKGWPSVRMLERHIVKRESNGMGRIFSKFGERWLICEEEVSAYLERWREPEGELK